VSNNSAYKKFNVEVIPDLLKNLGPAGGIYTALAHCLTEQIFVLSCDTPFVTTEAIEFIFQNANQSQITMPVHEGRSEPLFGVYSASCLIHWKILIQKGFLKLQEMVANFDLRQLNVDNNPLFNKNIFININTPDDLKKYNN
jgi:molybdopterin-guanine dinucleotide biosynthesis protein A